MEQGGYEKLSYLPHPTLFKFFLLWQEWIALYKKNRVGMGVKRSQPTSYLEVLFLPSTCPLPNYKCLMAFLP